MPDRSEPSRPLGPATLAAALLDPDAAPRERFILTCLCAAAGVSAALMAYLGAPQPPVWIAIAAAYVFGGTRTLREAVVALSHGKPEINFLMIFAALVSIPLGHWGDGLILLFLFSLSDALERYAIQRTRRSISSLMKLRPDTAMRVRGDAEEETPIERLAVGDRVRVRPGERFAVDGVVRDGRSSADEAIVTGESLPVEKQPGDDVFAGTINHGGTLIVEMTKAAGESTLARIVRMVEEAQEQKPRAQRLIEAWQTPYVLAVMFVCAAAIVTRAALTGDWSAAVYSGMVLLVAASPCAVVLASPVAVLAAVTRGARHGVLFKGGSHIERLAAIHTIAFDKTGTITRGKPAVTSIEPWAGATPDQVLTLAAAVEELSEHPLAVAIVAAARQRGLAGPAASEFESVAGFGASGMVAGVWVGVGRPELFERHGHAVPPELAQRAKRGDGETAVIVWTSEGHGGVVALRDEIRPEATPALEMLRQLDVRRLVMLTGDAAGPARRVAERVGIAEYKAGLKPQEKLEEIRRLAHSNSGVAMVGDGVNDAPALAAASVGVAMGAAGSDVALETADVVLLRDDLRSLAEAVHIARHCRQIIRQSLTLALGAIAMLVALTLAGWLILPLAVVGHEGSTVLVILNGLRLLWQHSLRRHLPAATEAPAGRLPAAA